MKALLTVLITSLSFVGCGRQLDGNSQIQTSNTGGPKALAHSRDSNGDATIPELTRYIATVKNAKECAKKIESIGGIDITNVLEAAFIVTFSSIPEDSELVAKLPCVLAVEIDGTVSPATLSSKRHNDVQIPEMTGYIATVKNTKECAKQIEDLGAVEITNILEAIGMVTFTSIPEQSKLVVRLPCVVAVELDGTVVANPSTRIGN